VNIDFNPGTHEYTVSGKVKRSTTQIITDLGLAPPYADNQQAKEFGTWVHKACEFAAWDKLDDAATSPVTMLPYINGFREKAAELKIRPIATELLVYHGLLDYCGTLDLLCWINADELAIVDFKCGQPPPCVELQTAGYVVALKWMSQKAQIAGLSARKLNAIRRFSMQLLPDRAILRECPDPFDLTAWEGAVNLWKWKRFRRDQR